MVTPQSGLPQRRLKNVLLLVPEEPLETRT
jgi:hypothetical protein